MSENITRIVTRYLGRQSYSVCDCIRAVYDEKLYFTRDFGVYWTRIIILMVERTGFENIA